MSDWSLAINILGECGGLSWQSLFHGFSYVTNWKELTHYRQFLNFTLTICFSEYLFEESKLTAFHMTKINIVAKKKYKK